MSLLDLLLPPMCAGCRGPNGPLCADCHRHLRPVAAAGDRFATPDAGAIVGVELTLALAAFAHRGVVRSSLAALKYEGHRRVVAELTRAALPSWYRLRGVAGPALVTSVPVHPERLASRGYNQAALLAGALAGADGTGCAELLARAHATERMHRLGRAERLRNLVGAFAATVRPPPVVIVVDDIVTTSATLEACATVLRRAGAREVYGFAIAREV